MLFCHMTSVGWIEIMIQHTPSIICDFYFPVDFRLDILFPHIFWFLHQNWVGISGFTLPKLRRIGDEEKIISSCLDIRSPMIAPPVLPESAFCAVKKTDWPKLDRFKLDRFMPVQQGNYTFCIQPVPKAYRTWKCCVKCKMKCSHLNSTQRSSGICIV